MYKNLMYTRKRNLRQFGSSLASLRHFRKLCGMRSCLALTTLKLLTVLRVVVTINKVVFPRLNKATYTYVEG